MRASIQAPARRHYDQRTLKSNLLALELKSRKVKRRPRMQHTETLENRGGRGIYVHEQKG